MSAIQTTHRMILRYDAGIGHRFVPGLQARIPGETGGWFVRTNAQGFRSDVDFVPAKGSRPRILFFGDSYTAGDGVSNEDRYTDRLGAMLGAEVYNFGLSGTGSDQQLLIFETLAKEIQADLVVIAPCVENIERNKVAYRESIDRVTGRRMLQPKPFFTLDDGALNLHQVPVPRERPDIGSVTSAPVQKKIPGGQKALYAALATYRKHPGLAPVRSAVRAWLPGLRSTLLRGSGYQPHPDYGDESSNGWRLMRAILERFAAAASPVPVLILPLPTYHFFYDGVEPTYQPRFRSLENRAQGVHVADVTDTWLALPKETRRDLRLRLDYHYSPAGHASLAEFAAAQIRARGLLPASIASVAPGDDAARKNGRRPHGRHILGVSCFYHNSGAALVRDGEIVAAAEEERFSRVKNDRRFPHHAANFCLEQAGVNPKDLEAVVYYDQAALTFERIVHTIMAVGDQGEDAFQRVMPSWLRFKLSIPELIREYLKYDGLVLHDVHHRSHAASAFHPSPFESAAILTIDGVGEWATASIGVGRGREMKLLREMRFPHSLGLLYSAFTQFTGFKVNSGEYKMMGLAPYGQPKYVDAILENIIDLKADGSVELNLDYFAFLSRPTTTSEKFAELFGGPARRTDAPITEREMDLAKSIQAVIEEAMLRMARHAKELTGEKNLCMAGGVALNCVANGRILREGPFEKLWIQPAAGDSGAALGAALDAWHTHFGGERKLRADGRSPQGGSLLGPSYSQDEVLAFVETYGHPHHVLTPEARAERVAELLEQGKVVGHFSGGTEFGPRALGSRSIIGDARNQEMQVNLNLKIKYRESFRPFAPVVLEEKVSEYFEIDRESPYMLLVAPVKASRRLPFTLKLDGGDMLPVVRQPRSDLPAITHVDYSARIQTIARPDHPQYYDLIRAFERRTGYAVIVNTSFNVRGEPIVCTPYDAYRCFMRTEMDALVLENVLLLKGEQPVWPEPKGHIEEDAPESETPVEESVRAALAGFFTTRVRPVMQALARQGVIQVRVPFMKQPSMWIEHPAPREVFAIPAAGADPASRARAIASAWAPGAAREAWTPLLADLLELGDRAWAGQPRTLEEEVPENVYVLY